MFLFFLRPRQEFPPMYSKIPKSPAAAAQLPSSSAGSFGGLQRAPSLQRGLLLHSNNSDSDGGSAARRSDRPHTTATKLEDLNKNNVTQVPLSQPCPVTRSQLKMMER